MDSAGVVGNLIGAGSTLAALLLVFLGAVVSNYSSLDAPQKEAVLRQYRFRAWSALAGFVLASLGAISGILAKVFQSVALEVAATVLVIVAFLWVLTAAVSLVRQIR
jgi:hypothetical protein